MNHSQFRFQELDVWKHAAAFSSSLFQVAAILDKKRLFRFAEQLRAATLSITNNIAEGCGSTSIIDFANFLNTARRSTFEVANILFVLSKNEYIDEKQIVGTISLLEQESRMLFRFIQELRSSQSGD